MSVSTRTMHVGYSVACLASVVLCGVVVALGKRLRAELNNQ